MAIGINWGEIWNAAIWDTAIWAQTAPAPAAPTTATGGNWFMRFESELERKRRRKRKEEEAEEATQALQAVEREIAAILHADLKADAERQDLERLRAMVAQFADREAEAAMSERVRKALVRAQTQANVSALLAFERELRQMLEEEEMFVLMMLVD